jgi:hypothetical protein
MKCGVSKKLLLALAMFGAVNMTSAQIQWRLSVKYFTDSFGNLPAPGNGIGSRAELTNHLKAANALLRESGRGYQLVLAEVVDLRGLSQWFDLPARSEANKQALEAAAIGNPTLYLWRAGSINVYINNSSSGICSFPGSGSLIFLGQSLPGGAINASSLFHEIGHFFNLCHTHGCPCGDCGSDFDCDAGLRSDEIPDTLQDNACWDNQDRVAINNFTGRRYDQLNDAQRAEVDAVFFNIMSYHPTRDRLTPDQLDRMTDTSNGDRINVANGRTWFVDRNCSGLFRNGSSQCGSFSGPFTELTDGVNSAQGGDTVLIRAGSYFVPQMMNTINKPITLRASRGNVTIDRRLDLGTGP